MPIQNGHNLFNSQQEADFGAGLTSTTHVGLGQQPVTTADNIRGGWISIPSSANTHSLLFNQLDTGQVIYARNEEKLYYVEINVMGQNGYFVPGGDPVTNPYYPNSASFTEFTFPGGDPTGVGDSLSINNLTVNDGGIGTKFELEDEGTLTLTAQGTTNILLIQSGANDLGLKVNGDGLIQLDQYNYTPPAVEGGLLYSGSAYYLGMPSFDNIFISFQDTNMTSFTDNSIFDVLNYTFSTPSLLLSQLRSNNFSVAQGDTFSLTFNINLLPEVTTVTSVDANDFSNELVTYIPIAGDNDITITSTFNGDMMIAFNFFSENTDISINNIKLTKLN